MRWAKSVQRSAGIRFSRASSEELRSVVTELLQTVAKRDADLVRLDAQITFKHPLITDGPGYPLGSF